MKGFKEYRNMTVSTMSGYRYKPTPAIRLSGQVIIFHAHSGRIPYHLHGRAGSLRQAVRSIQSHDRWQLKGRPKKGR